MKTFKNIYLETIYPIQNNILSISARDNNGKQFIYKFNFNQNKILPQMYKNVSIFNSGLNKDLNHVLNRINQRLNKQYTFNDILIIVKKAIDYYLNNINNFKFNQSFLICSKQYPNIKMVIQITKNNIELQDKIELSERYNNIFYCDYFCFIYTILTQNMISNNQYDKELILEESKEIYV